MFSASLSLAAKDTPRTGKKYQGVFAVSRRGGDEKTDGRTKNACFLHRMPLKTRRVHQEPLYGTARPFRTPGGPLRYRMLHRQKGERPCLYRMPDARKEEPLAGTEQGGGFSGETLFDRTNEPKVAKCPVDWRLTGPNSQENHSQKVCNATQSYSMPPESRHYTVI